MRRKNDGFSPPAVGGSSLLVIFAVLCLTVFAMLSLTTAQANARLSQAAAQAVTDYYDADRLAEELFARIRNGETPAGVTAAGETYTYTCPISEERTLCVTVQHTRQGWAVLEWRAAYTGVWAADESLPVWQGD